MNPELPSKPRQPGPFEALCRFMLSIILALLALLLALGVACFGTGDHSTARQIAALASVFLVTAITWWRLFVRPVLAARAADMAHLNFVLQKLGVRKPDEPKAD